MCVCAWQDQTESTALTQAAETEKKYEVGEYLTLRALKNLHGAASEEMGLGGGDSLGHSHKLTDM